MNKKRLIVFFIILSVILTFLSGCASTGDLSGFLVPPQTTAKMKELKNDIYSQVGSEVTFLSPSEGNYRNTINFCDIDSDGEDEAVAVYAPQSGDKVAHILILKHSLGKWALLIDFTMSGSSVDILDFIDYDGNSAKELVIGVSSNVADSKGLSVYDVSGTEPKELLTQSYNNIYITATNQILTVSLDKTTGNTARLIMSDNKLPKVVSECALYGTVSSISNIVYGTVETGAAFFISESLDGTNTLTEILTVDNNTISNKTLKNGQTLFDAFLKRVGIPYIQDIDADGKTEISRVVQITGTNKSSAESLKLLEWSGFTGDAFSHKLYTVINPNERYYFIVPNKWIGKIFAKQEQNVSAITFYAEGDAGQINLFSVYAMTDVEWESKDNKVNWSLIKKSNDRIYALYIYNPASELSSLYSITPAELDKQFIHATLIQR